MRPMPHTKSTPLFIIVVGLGAFLYHGCAAPVLLTASMDILSDLWNEGWPRGMALVFMGTRRLMGSGTTCTN